MEKLIEILSTSGLRLLGGIAELVLGFVAVHYIMKLVEKSKGFAKLEPTLRKATLTVNCRDLDRRLSVTQLPKMDQQLQVSYTTSQITVPLLVGSTLAGKINWGDGVEETYKAGLTHDYSTAGNHTMVIKCAGAITMTIESLDGVTSVDLQQF